MTLHELAELLGTKVRRGEDGEPVLVGRCGNIHADGGGFLVYAESPDGIRRRTAESLVKQAGGRVTQRGDTEIVGFVPEKSRKLRLIKELCGILDTKCKSKLAA